MNLTLTTDAGELRRAVGVTAWCVLEQLVLDASTRHAGCVVVSTNVRDLASAVGVSKDTAARAVTRLVRAGVVARVTNGRGERGTFPTASYAVDITRVPGLDTHIDTTPAPLPEPPPASPSRTRTRSTSHVTTPQPSLFDLPAPTP